MIYVCMLIIKDKNFDRKHLEDVVYTIAECYTYALNSENYSEFINKLNKISIKYGIDLLDENTNIEKIYYYNIEKEFDVYWDNKLKKQKWTHDLCL